MNVGDVFRTKRIKNNFSDGKSWTEFDTRNKDEVFVCLLLGFEPLVVTDDNEEQCVDVAKVLRAAGWMRRRPEPIVCLCHSCGAQTDNRARRRKSKKR